MELLAPAGSPEQLLAALDAGADAVYMGGKAFSARKYAGNFSREEMAEAVAVCHTLGVAVYVTLNTLISDGEWEALEEYIQFLGTISIDGLLVQDLGVARAVRRIAPHIPLHASTQMTVSNLDGVRFLEKLGFTRAVLSRELSLEEMKSITSETNMEIEVFVHGALCVCYSGQCLMSSFIGGRSGNRGSCAQPCRMPYDLVDDAGRKIVSPEGHYILSMKDMTALDRIRDLARAGVLSLKVEGRMKSPDYVYEVISAYRTALSAFEAGEMLDEAGLFRRMKEHFNRGYTHGFYDNAIGASMMTGFVPGNHGVPAGKIRSVKKGTFSFYPDFQPEQKEIKGISYITQNRDMEYISIGQLSFRKDGMVSARYEKAPAPGGMVYWHTEKETLHFSLRTMRRKVPLYFSLRAVPGEAVTLSAYDGEGSEAVVTSDYQAEKAEKRVTGEEEIRQQLGRLGNTLFSMAEVSVENEGCMIPKSVLNHLRQTAIEKMEEARGKAFIAGRMPAKESSILPILSSPEESTAALVLRTDRADTAMDAMEHGIARIVFGGESFGHRPIPGEDYVRVLRRAREQGVHVTFASPRVVREENRELVKRQFLSLGNLLPDAMEIQFLGAFEWGKELPSGVALEAGASLNLFNREALHFIEELGFGAAYVSPELTLGQIRTIAKDAKIPVGVYVYGRSEMMVSEYCVINALLAHTDKKHCPAPCLKGRYSLLDEGGRRFPVRTDEWCHMHILNSATLDMRPYMKKLMGTGVAQFCLDLRGIQEDVGRLIQSFQGAMAGKEFHKNGAEAVTRGHFFRGVL